MSAVVKARVGFEVRCVEQEMLKDSSVRLATFSLVTVEEEI